MKKFRWLIVLGCCFMVMAFQGIVNNCYSVYIISVSKDLGISRSAFTLTQTIHFMSVMFGSFFSWHIFKRFGIVRTVRICSIIVACLYCSYGAVIHVTGFYFRSVIIGCCVGMSSTTPITLLIKKWFGAESSTAQGWAFLGSGLGSSIFLKLANATLESFGWRTTYLVLGLCVGLLSILPTFLIIRLPEKDVSSEAIGGKNGAFEGAKIPVGITAILLFCILLSGIAQGTQVYIITPYLQDIGYSSSFAATVSSISFVLIAGGKVLEGILIDKRGIKTAMRVSYGCLIVALISMCLMSRAWLLVVFLLCSIYSNSFPTMLAPMLPLNLYDKEIRQKAVGWYTASISCGFSMSSILPSLVYDRFGSYVPMFIASAAVCVAVMIIVDVILHRYLAKAPVKELNPHKA